MDVVSGKLPNPLHPRFLPGTFDTSHGSKGTESSTAMLRLRNQWPEIKHAIIILSKTLHNTVFTLETIWESQSYFRKLVSYLNQRHRLQAFHKTNWGKIGHEEGIFTKISFNHSSVGLGFGKWSPNVWTKQKLFAPERSDDSTGMSHNLKTWL